MKGQIALHGNRSTRDWSKRVQRRKRPLVKIKCETCQQWLWKNSPNQRFCGALKRKTGCSYKNYIRLCSMNTSRRKRVSKERYVKLKTEIGHAPYKWSNPSPSKNKE